MSLPWQYPVALALYLFVAGELARQALRSRRRAKQATVRARSDTPRTRGN